MTTPDPPDIIAHRDVDLFREAVTYTAASTGFSARLIEKDYFCTVILAYLARADAGLVFKGGTALTKVHTQFYRLSEDLDFAIPTPVDATRRQRSMAARPLKRAVGRLEETLPEFVLHKPLRGANNSTQYLALLGYSSPTANQRETLRIEVSLREPLLLAPIEGPVRTMLRNPISDAPLAPDLRLPCIDLREALAEKLRAALTRRDVAIRDFYDLHHAAELFGLSTDTPPLLDLVRHKLAVPGTRPVDLSSDRVAPLYRQRDGQLRPVLRREDFNRFDLDRAICIARKVANLLDA